ncbi:MAG: acyl-protein synthetase [Candidatus Hodarchaeota archaeon]
MDQDQIIKEIITANQYNLAQKEKEAKLLPIFKEQIKTQIDSLDNLKSFYNKFNVNIDNINSLNELPPIPVNMFKKFDLRTCKKEDVLRVLHSSSTTTGIPSKIYIDKKTAFRQTRSFLSTIKNFIGKERRPLLIIDTEEVDKADTDTLTARGAAIRAITNFATKKVYVMDLKNGDLEVNFDRLKEFCDNFEGQNIIVYGFTYIIWSRFYKILKEKKLLLNFPNIKILHSGGWKKLIEQQVDKKTFNSEIASIFNTSPKNVIDYYGMVEQVGVVFVDCEEGWKHVPDFAEVIIRDFYTMSENKPKNPGLIEVMSILPTSYPGQALLTEDVGEIIGIDDCPCGRKGKYFTFRSRVRKVELRGCGDTFAERRGD